MKKIIFEKLTVQETKHIKGTGGTGVTENKEDCDSYGNVEDCSAFDDTFCKEPSLPSVDCTMKQPSGQLCQGQL